ncbi:DNA topoisomerase VI subunit B, partial [Halobacteriota archaeon]
LSNTTLFPSGSIKVSLACGFTMAVDFIYSWTDICKAAAIDLDEIPANLSHDQAKHLLGAFRKVRIQAPPTDCLSPIGEDQIHKGLGKEYYVDFVSTTTRAATVHSGNPFIVEAGIAFGGSLHKDDRIEILRFANKVPLLYQQGGCAITHAIGNVNWRNYELNQSGGNGIPVGPAVVFVHVASTKVPFTSESKDAIADIPEIMNEIKLAVQEVARDMKNYISRKKLLEKRKDKEEIIKKILPKMVAKVSSILKKEEPDIRPVIAKIMGNVLIQKEITQKDDECVVSLKASNFGEHARSFKLHELSKYDVVEAPGAQIVNTGNSISMFWKISLGKGEQKTIYYTIDFIGIPEMQAPIVEGIDKEIITGAEVA